MIYINKVIHLVSGLKRTGLESLKNAIWDKLKLVRVYLKKPDGKPDYESPLIVKDGTTLLAVAEKIGQDFAKEVKGAKIWGPGSKFPGQRVSLNTPVTDGMKVTFLT